MKTLSERRQEISHAPHGGQETVGTPRPMADDRINETGNADAVNEVANETRSADHRAGRDGGAGVRKRELKQPERQEGDAGGLISGRRALQEEPVIPNQPITVAEHEGEAE